MQGLMKYNVVRRPLQRALCQSVRPAYSSCPHVTPPTSFSRISYYSSVNGEQPSLLKITHYEDESFMGNIKIISLDSPHNRNALSKKLLSELSTELKALKEAGDGSHGGTRALILASELDTVFCAGADLKERKAMSDDE